LDINISQGSVAKYLMRGGIFNYHFTVNLLLSEKTIWKATSIW